MPGSDLGRVWDVSQDFLEAITGSHVVNHRSGKRFSLFRENGWELAKSSWQAPIAYLKQVLDLVVRRVPKMNRWLEHRTEGEKVRNELKNVNHLPAFKGHSVVSRAKNR